MEDFVKFEIAKNSKKKGFKRYPEFFDYVVEEIKPYINNDNNKDDIYNLFIGIADKASLKYILPNKELLTVSDMEEYFILTSDNN